MQPCFLRTLGFLVAGSPIGLPALPRAVAQVPSIPVIPSSFPDFVRTPATAELASLQARVSKLVADGAALNQQCAHFKRGSAMEVTCRSDLSAWQAEQRTTQQLAEAQKAQVDFLVDLVTQYQNLTTQIDGNVARMNELGMHHRAQDFEDWTKLASGAQDDFAKEVKNVLTEVTVSEAQSGILGAVKGISPGTAEKFTAMLDEIHPRPTGVIAAVQRMTTNESRTRLAEDAEMVAQYLERAHAGWTAQTTEEIRDFEISTLCAISPGEDGLFQKQCELFADEAKILSAELYYGAATVVAKQQVASLINLTEDQLRAVAARTRVLIDQVNQRKEVRARIESILKQMQENNASL